MSRFVALLDTATDKEKSRTLRALAQRIIPETFTWNPPSIGANTTVDTTLSTTDDPAMDGLRSTMVFSVTPPSTLNAGIVVGGAWCAADDTLTIRLGNLTAAPINPASGTWAFLAVLT